MARYALILEYDGSSFHGWQSQIGVATIQGSLDIALSKFANEEISTITAGRTDTGVHALNQVVHFSSNAKRNLSAWIYGVNALLPKSVRIKQVIPVSENFDARFSALSRTYHYYLLIRPHNTAHFRNNIGWYYKELNLENMQKAASLLIGTHDFSSFRASGCQANTPIRSMSQLNIAKKGDLIRFSLTANAFLHHMVRNIVGALIYVGDDKITVSEFADIFKMANRKLAPPTFMPNGLYLANINYSDEVFIDFDEDIWILNLGNDNVL